MNITFITAEYNLLHNGHIKQIEYIREKNGDDSTIVAIMSGNFVQRGDFAIADKYTRASAAIKCGVDLVLELPYPYSCSGAEFFATASVSTADEISRMTDSENNYSLCFGSESGDIEKLRVISERITSCEYLSALKEKRDEAVSTSDSDIKIREAVYNSLYGEGFPTEANDILGVEYLNALKKLNSSVAPFTLKRVGKESATLSRKLFSSGDFSALSEISPKTVIDGISDKKPMSLKSAECFILGYFRTFAGDIPKTDGMNKGLFNLLCANAGRCSDYEAFVSICANKKYTDARIRRTILHSIFGITTADLKEKPCYTVTLGMNERGRRLLSSVRKSESAFKIITKPADAFNNDNGIIRRQYGSNFRADSLYSLSEGKASDEYVKKSPYVAEF